MTAAAPGRVPLEVGGPVWASMVTEFGDPLAAAPVAVEPRTGPLPTVPAPSSGATAWRPAP